MSWPATRISDRGDEDGTGENKEYGNNSDKGESDQEIKVILSREKVKKVMTIIVKREKTTMVKKRFCHGRQRGWN